jgi:hypothetical protein
MKPKLYVETTILGYLTKRTSRDVLTAAHQKITQEWWKKRRHAFDLYCSELVLKEASAGEAAQAKERLSHLAQIPALAISADALALAKSLLKREALPPKSEDDATHLAIAAVNAMRYLLTWNCAHLANASLRPLIERICKKAGHHCPIICTPEQLLED